mmetsp:Transcript_35725/g.86453  ORF Transcript_35725/g.86453 Transcript_35725/m.86453 type:complete len:571 (-) Transcript_35725:2069-3781(-)
MSKRQSEEDSIQDEERNKPHSAKRPRSIRKRNLEAADSSIELPLDALCLVMEFLSPRQLYNLAFSCKTLRGFITTPLVVRSALIHGGHAKQTMKELYDLMSEQSMHAPSPLRLLRLVNGKRCEFCNTCQVHHVRPELGVFACRTCRAEQDLTILWTPTWEYFRNRNMNKYLSIFAHPQIASNWKSGSGAYMWAKHRRLSNGEIIGPLATFEDIHRIFQYIREDDGTIDAYIENNLLAPSDTEGAYQEFNHAYEETLQRAENVAADRKEKKETNKQKAWENKVTKVRRMIADLKDLLEEPYKELALSRKEVDYCNNGSSTKVNSKAPIVRFDVAFVDKLLRPFVVSPSKLRKKALVDIAKNINEKLSLLSTTNFATLSFLSEDDAFEAGLKDHFGTKFTDIESLFNMTIGDELLSYSKKKKSGFRAQTMINDRFFGLLEKGQLISALAHLVRKDLSSCLFPAAHSVGETKLARTIWFHTLKGKGDDDQQFRTAYTVTTALLPKARRGLEGYSTWMEKAFRRDTNRDERRSFAFEKACSDASVLSLLVAESFRELDKKISKGYGSKSWYKYC